MNNTKTFIAPDGKEIRQHGSYDFPCQLYNGPDPEQVPWHWHEEYECTIVLKGEIYCSTPQGHFLLKAGEGIFLNSGTLHSAEIASSNDFSVKTLVFHGRLIYGAENSIFFQKYITSLSAPDTPPMFLLSPEIPWQYHALDCIKKASLIYEEKNTGHEFTVRALLSELLFEMYSHRNSSTEKMFPVNPTENQRIKKMLLFLQEHFSQPVTVAQLAAHANICERECLRCFQKVLRLSPIQYLIRYRISRACMLLQDSTLSVMEIGNSCGFESHSYFTKMFRQHMGCTPSQYRKQFFETL